MDKTEREERRSEERGEKGRREEEKGGEGRRRNSPCDDGYSWALIHENQMRKEEF